VTRSNNPWDKYAKKLHEIIKLFTNKKPLSTVGRTEESEETAFFKLKSVASFLRQALGQLERRSFLGNNFTVILRDQ